MNIFLIILTTVLLTTSQDTLAYLDPGTGSMILQAVVGIFFAGLFFLKNYFAKIKGFFKKSSTENEDK